MQRNLINITIFKFLFSVTFVQTTMQILWKELLNCIVFCIDKCFVWPLSHIFILNRFKISYFMIIVTNFQPNWTEIVDN